MAEASSLTPREHGAYGQLGFPIATALALGRPTIAAVSIACASVLAFLAHEPLLVVLGQRGARALREGDARARARLAGLLGGACIAAGVGVVVGPPRAREALAVPMALALAVGGLIATKREKTLAGELLVGSTLSACSLPVALASGVAPCPSIGAAAVWVLGFGCATIAVRGVIARASGGSGPLLAASGVVVVSASLLAFVGWTWRGAWVLPAAALPKLVASLALSVRPPPPQKLRAVGWMLIVASAACAAILVVGLR
jgi:hypothetical protein